MPAIALRAASLVDVESQFPRNLQIIATTGDPAPHARALHCMEFTSRGDRVPLSLWLPIGERPAPLVCLQYGAGGSIDADHDAAVEELLATGLAVATMDWPLHGARRSVKLSDRLVEALSSDGDDANGAPLIEQFVLQGTVDLAHAIEAMTNLAEVRSDTVGLAGVGIGATLAVLVASIDQRPMALCLAPAHDRPVEAGLSLDALIGAGSRRPILLLARKSGSGNPTERLDAIRRAGAAKAELEHVSGRLDPLDREGARHMARFFGRTLA